MSPKRMFPKILPEVLATSIKPAATIKYPAERADIPVDFRGKIKFNPKLCIGCKMCMRDCPAKAIKIEPTGAEKVFKCTFELDHCIFCAQCVDSCPRKALINTPEFELANFQRKDLKETQE